jgi:hypothetical protein
MPETGLANWANYPLQSGTFNEQATNGTQKNMAKGIRSYHPHLFADYSYPLGIMHPSLNGSERLPLRARSAIVAADSTPGPPLDQRQSSSSRCALTAQSLCSNDELLRGRLAVTTVAVQSSQGSAVASASTDLSPHLSPHDRQPNTCPRSRPPTSRANSTTTSAAASCMRVAPKPAASSYPERRTPLRSREI